MRPDRRRRRWWRARHEATVEDGESTDRVAAVHIAPGDPLLRVLAVSGSPVDLAHLGVDSPAVGSLLGAGIRVVTPVVSHGDLVGIVVVGERRSEQNYSPDDLRLLSGLASRAAPAMRLAELIAAQESLARQRARVEAEFRVATLIQQNFLPRGIEPPTGWTFDAVYQPAREVGGDFYDLVELPDGRWGITTGDVTDKGVPAALVMASTRSIVRAAAQRIPDPAKVLHRANEQLAKDMPPGMFVTCLYGVLDPIEGSFRFANAGHNLPLVRRSELTEEPRATGMPLGLLPDASYDEATVMLGPGDELVLYSDALPEAHGPGGTMFGFDAVRATVAAAPRDGISAALLGALTRFTGPDWVQEDDITILALGRDARDVVVTERGGGGRD